ncbi:uncharacterized protein LOC135816471 [Sycon ciliatum]|uniref:uncharacterized protein LOC135816471 n=1 Tax=Sycon ciliatum TaxID=27933 RepID=UPI0031F688B2
MILPHGWKRSPPTRGCWPTPHHSWQVISGRIRPSLSMPTSGSTMMPGCPTTANSVWPRRPSLTAIPGPSLTRTCGSLVSRAVGGLRASVAPWSIQVSPAAAPFVGGSQPLQRLLGASSRTSLALTAKPSVVISTSAAACSPPAPEHTSACSAAAVTPHANAPSLVTRPRNNSHPSGDAALQVPTSTPVHVRRFINLLSPHPNAVFRSYVSQGMQYGFRIGSSRPIASSVMSPNHPSACACPAEVTTHLLTCCDRGETAGPFASPPFPHMHISGLGAIPKSNGKLRIIHDLSSPAGLSVNDGISRDEFSLQYETVDTAISLIMQAGRGALLTKVDIRNAFRLCPVAPCDWPYLGIFWQGQFYHDKVLPFGLRSAPYIFDKFATAVQFILEDACHLSQLLHYLDDFLNVSPPHLPVAEHHRSLILDMLRYLQIPVASEKVEGPSTCLTFLGLELDSLTFEIRLPSAKHGTYIGKVNGLLQSGMASRRELASVLGNLSFAARAIPAGRTFLRRLYDLDRATSNLPKHKVLTLSAGAVNDLKWWQRTLSVWPGKPFFLLDKWTKAPNLQLQTDASGNQGYGAYFQGRWIRGAWLPHQHSESIQYKELYAIVIATSTWASEWKSLRIEFQCDNSAVVDCIKSGTSRSPPMMSLVRCLYHLCVAHDCLISAVHIPGVTNTIADALSRNLLQEFRRLAPTAQLHPDMPILPTPD